MIKEKQFNSTERLLKHLLCFIIILCVEVIKLDYNKVGKLIYQLRKEQGMTQKQLAERMNISDKAISKWERGLGCPDVSLLNDLADIFHINVEKLLEGELEPNSVDTGNFKRIKFYACPACKNIINNSGNADISCCGRRLSPMIAKPADQMHMADIEDAGGEYYITFSHEMSKSHYISFVAYVTTDRVLLVKLYPEQTASVRLPKISGGRLGNKNGAKIYYYCSRHGLWVL